ncbi:hypothetical protein TPHA_0F01990 [Tetrapisispora phaffii CBS 4417]|uniref:C2 domain-containing protein n=1 Tax=Tetrapisispora phaffii (strain ATCC 24235 / CBS 4417 / NBRC 1672 / NRRL Y-8282 / UCD 70-5) TaxID=1071381 RepID=G8BV99_TETPH|nr:hypothetical protein TPHA_0F01990 [Tetrapisispora phaffii CBS 4417]CCE63681.1 hypothetical protein TPHA_0F01990 [Tetrapisispora phaffii CBS 4417]
MLNQSIDNDQGMLTVFISKAKDLPNLNKLDKQDVTLRLRIAHMTRESEIQRRAGQTPIFNYLEKFQMTPDVQRVMHIELYCERKKKAPLPIGRCEVDLVNGMRADPKEGYCSWYELKREKNEFAGTIFIELTYTPILPRIHKSQDGHNTRRADASIAARPIPPLPHETQYTRAFRQEDVQTPPYLISITIYFAINRSSSRSPERYMHASNLRHATPSAFKNSNGSYYSSKSESVEVDEFINTERSNGSTNNNSISNFTSSVDTSTSMRSQESAGTTSTNTTDTRFHFANLRKLKEKINVFKNPLPSSELQNESNESPVDIEALQKAIGITSVESDNSDDEYLHSTDHDSYGGSNNYQRPQGHTRVSTKGSNRFYSEKTNVPELPQVPTAGHASRSPTNNSYENFSSRSSSVLPTLPELNHERSPRHRTPSKIHSPEIPQLPNSPRSRQHSQSPSRRPPPPNF